MHLLLVSPHNLRVALKVAPTQSFKLSPNHRTRLAKIAVQQATIARDTVMHTVEFAGSPASQNHLNQTALRISESSLYHSRISTGAVGKAFWLTRMTFLQRLFFTFSSQWTATKLGNKYLITSNCRLREFLTSVEAWVGPIGNEWPDVIATSCR